ncbi:MAG: argininosuccinate lyase, partial [Acidaminococcaceae bacterium]
ATDLADYLVRKGLPFRQAHEVVGKCVAYAILQGKFLPEITLPEYLEFSELFAEDLLTVLQPANCVAART